MNKRNIWKFSMPALSMSALVFELLPGSVDVWQKDVVTAPEIAYHFFNLNVAHRAAAFLPIAGIVTAATMVLALVCAFFKKDGLLKAVSWCAMASAVLTSMPYLMPTAGVILRPNVVVTVLLFAVWIIARMLAGKDKPAEKEVVHLNGRLH